MATDTDLSFVVRMFRKTSDKNEASLRMSRQCNDPEWAAPVDRGVVACRKLANPIERPENT
jgi:hypothetical protein